MLLPYADACTFAPRCSVTVYELSPAPGNTSSRASDGSFTSGFSPGRSVYPTFSRTVLHRRARRRFESVTTRAAPSVSACLRSAAGRPAYDAEQWVVERRAEAGAVAGRRADPLRRWIEELLHLLRAHEVVPVDLQIGTQE